MMFWNYVTINSCFFICGDIFAFTFLFFLFFETFLEGVQPFLFELTSFLILFDLIGAATISLHWSLSIGILSFVSCTFRELIHWRLFFAIKSFFAVFQNSSLCFVYFLFALSLWLNCSMRCSAGITSAGLSQFLDLCRTIALATSLFCFNSCEKIN